MQIPCGMFHLKQMKNEFRSYGYIDMGIHKISPSMNFDELIRQKHAMRFTRIFDTPEYLLGDCICFCTQNKLHWLVWNKNTGEYFKLQDQGGAQNITNDLGGPNFQPFACVYPGLFIGMAEAINCPEEFAEKYNVKVDDNPVLVMVKCKP